MAARLRVGANTHRQPQLAFSSASQPNQAAVARRVLSVGEAHPMALTQLSRVDAAEQMRITSSTSPAGGERYHAGAAVDEPADAGLVAALSTAQSGGTSRSSMSPISSSSPSGRPDVLVRSQQDPRLARARLRGESVSHSTRPCVRSRIQRAMAGRCRHASPGAEQATPARGLEVDDSGDVGRGDHALALRDPVRSADDVMLSEPRITAEPDAHRCDHEGGKGEPNEVVDP